MSGEDKVKVVIKLGQLNKIEDLKVIVDNFDLDEIKSICERKIRENDINVFLHFLLQGFGEDNKDSKLKRFDVVRFVLGCLDTEELNTKSTVDLVSRLFLELDKFNNEQIVDLVEGCVDSIRQSSSRTTFWKDLLPQLAVVVNTAKSIKVNGIEMSGAEYRSAIVKNMCMLKWHIEKLIPLASTFKEMLITKEERDLIINKLCENIFQVEAPELPALAFQLFGLCNSPAQLIVPVLFLQKYFNKYYYTREYLNMDSNTTAYDSIDQHSPQELQRAQETVFYHLGTCTEFKVTEKDVVAVFRHLASTPHYLLTPFMISALLTLSKVNRQPELVRLSASEVLPFLRRVIQNNECEREKAAKSQWCRHTFDRPAVDLDKVVAILIDQSITGMEVVTPGVIALAFTLLKAKAAPELNHLGISFLHQFLKKRYIFGQGVLRQLTELLFANQESAQYAECLNTLSLTNTLTVSECVQTVQSTLDFLPLIPGHHAMRMITFVYPLIKISFAVRDQLIAVLSKSMADTDATVRKVGVYGFCMLLKNLKNNNSRRAITSANNLSFTQASISGFSLMSQTTLANRDDPQRHFDILVLEIIGLLRKCFNETHETKEILYEGLTRAIEFNPKLTSHLLLFMDWHFRSYFNIDSVTFEVRFEQVVRAYNNSNSVEIWDNLGKLVTFMGCAVVTCAQNGIVHNTSIVAELLQSLVERVDTITVDRLNLTATELKSKEIASQFVQFLEGIMAYAILAATPDNNFMEKFGAVFRHHQKVSAELKGLFGEKRSGTAAAGKNKVKSKEKSIATSTPNTSTEPYPNTQFTLGESTAAAATLEEKAVIAFKPSNIWEIGTLERLMNAVFSDSVSFASADQLKGLREDLDFRRYLLKVTTEHVEGYRSLPDYRHVKHSRRMFQFLSQTTRLVYEQCIKGMVVLIDNFDTVTAQLCVECFHQCLLTADAIYRRKLEELFSNVTGSGDRSLTVNAYQVVRTIHELLDKCMAESSFIDSDADSRKIQKGLLQCLELLYEHLAADQEESRQVYQWLITFCSEHSIDGKHLDLIHKLLFQQRVKHYDGAFFKAIAAQIGKRLGQLTTETVEECCNGEFELKSISEATAESCFVHLCAVLRREIEDIEYMINKVKSQTAKIKFLGEKGTEDDHIQSLKTMERAICAHLIHVVGALIHLTNMRLPLGTCSDLLVRLLIQCYVCVTNITKHLVARHSVLPVVYAHIRFDKLVQVAGKPLAGRIYDFITYIDQNVMPAPDASAAAAAAATASGSSRSKVAKDPQATKKKILRETRSLPKLILWIEVLHKCVMQLERKAAVEISHYLHLGIVRDFRIKSTDLASAVRPSEAAADSDSNEGDAGDEEIVAAELYDDDDSDATTMEGIDDDRAEINGGGSNAVERIMRNVAKISKKARAKASEDAPLVTKGKRRRQPAIKIPKSAAVDAEASKPPTPKRPRRSAKK